MRWSGTGRLVTIGVFGVLTAAIAADAKAQGAGTGGVPQLAQAQAPPPTAPPGAPPPGGWTGGQPPWATTTISPPPGFVRWIHPGGMFSIDHPAEWRVRSYSVAAYGMFSFFKDDPQEGTGVTVLPSDVVNRAVTPTDILGWIAQRMRQRYGDFELISASQPALGPVGPPGISTATFQEAQSRARWTNAKGEKMAGKLRVVSMSAVGTTVYTYLVGQGPEAGFATLEPTLDRVMESYGDFNATMTR